MCRNSQCQQLSQSKYPFTKNYLTHSKAVDLTVGGASIRQWGSATIDSNSFSGSAAITGVLRMTGGWGGYIRADAFYIFANSAKGIIFANSAKGIVLERYTNGSNAYSWPLPQIRRNKFTIAASQFRRAVSAPYAVLDPALGSSIDATHNIWGVGDVPANVAYIIDDYYDHQEETPKKAVVNFQPYDLDGGGGGGGGGCPYVFAWTDTGLVVENSILGLSEVTPAGTFISDALALRHAVPDSHGRVRLRIRELEEDTDVLDRVGLVLVRLEPGEEIGANEQGQPVVFSFAPVLLRQVAWTGKGRPSISPIAPGDSYVGEVSDSLDLAIPPSNGSVPGRRRIVMSLVPKPEQAPNLPNLPGVTVRVSSQSQGDEWITLPPIVPREYWSSIVLGDGLGEDFTPSRIRVIWRTKHTLGRIGLASVRPVVGSPLSPATAVLSSGQSVEVDLKDEDGRTVTLLPGEFADLEFEAGALDPRTQLVLVSYGRYDRQLSAGLENIPRAHSLGQNRPNPFNPETRSILVSQLMAKRRSASSMYPDAW